MVNAAVTASRYTLYGDKALGSAETRPAGLRWDAFDGVTAAYSEVSGAYGPDEAPNSFEIRPQPAAYGWGLLLYSPAGVSENLSGFAAGSLTFMVSTTYPGKIEIGISTDTQDRDAQEAFLQLAPGQYGYCSTGAWCTVTIPLKDFLAVNPKLDLSMVLTRFMIADRYGFTGKAQGSAVRTPIRLDAIGWRR